jgi:hypothetical protein
MANTMREMETLGHDAQGRRYVQLGRDVYTYTPDHTRQMLHWLTKRAAFVSYLRAYAIEFTPENQ